MKSLGQVAYERFHEALGLEVGDEDWDVRQNDYRAAWELAAESIRDAIEVECFPLPVRREALVIADTDREVAA